MKVSRNLKLIVSFLLVVAITGAVATVMGVHSIGDRVIKQAQEKVKMDLNSAREVYEREVNDILTIVRLTATRFFLRDYFLQNEREQLIAQLEEIRKEESLDILTLTDRNGNVFARARNPQFYSDNQRHNPLIKEVLQNKEPVAGTEIVSREELSKESDDLVRQAHIEFIPTPKSRPRTEKEETSGTMVKAAAPIFDRKNNLIGVLYGGKLINRNYEIVDKVKDIVYRGETYKGKDIGTATIFQWDLRISTNVKKIDGERAIGTRVSEEIYEQVLEKGNPWIGRAFVVNDWYITSYEPIKDFVGKIIGILYVGILEEKFLDIKKQTLWEFLSITFIGVVMALIVSLFLAKGFIRPVRQLVSASKKLAEGNLDYRVELNSKDEFGKLGDAFNIMAKSIKERDEKLKEQTRRKLMESEKLATIGQLAAGIAHEINNPLTTVMTFSHLLLEDTDKNDPKYEDLQLMIKETIRCRDIVRKLLDFSRQKEPQRKVTNINRVIEQTLSIFETQALFQNIKIDKYLSETMPDITVDPDQIQQVFTNVILNAAEAMPEGGTLSITARMAQEDKFVEIKFSDTGCGIIEVNMDKLFDPFFTTKEKGTGLGLSVSYGIIKSHDGMIGVESTEGKGSTFTVLLPVKLNG